MKNKEKDPIKVYKLGVLAMSLLVLSLGLFIIGFGFLSIFTGLSTPKTILTAFIFGIKFAYGSGLIFELIFLLIGTFLSWNFYKHGTGEIGAIASFTATSILHIFTLSYAYAVILYYETGNITQPVKFIRDLVLWSGAGLFYIIFLTITIVLLGLAHTKRQNLNKI